MSEPYTKAEIERRRGYPLNTGARTLTELVSLIQQGKTYRQIAAQWGMRPNAGAVDLRCDILRMWQRAGAPGDAARPLSADYMSPEWDQWRASRDDAIARWLATLSEDGVPAHHCATCTCRIVEQMT